jgi:hypothetical protein
MEWSVPLALAVYILAHILFWPPWFATRLVAPRLRIQSLSGMASLMAVASVLIWVPAALVMLILHRDPAYGWQTVVRDTGSLGAASAAAYFFYAALSGLCRSDPALVVKTSLAGRCLWLAGWELIRDRRCAPRRVRRARDEIQSALSSREPLQQLLPYAR